MTTKLQKLADNAVNNLQEHPAKAFDELHALTTEACTLQEQASHTLARKIVNELRHNQIKAQKAFLILKTHDVYYVALDDLGSIRDEIDNMDIDYGSRGVKDSQNKAVAKFSKDLGMPKAQVNKHYHDNDLLIDTMNDSVVTNKDLVKNLTDHLYYL